MSLFPFVRPRGSGGVFIEQFSYDGVTANAIGSTGANFADSGGYLFTTTAFAANDPIYRTPLGTAYDLSSASSTETYGQSQ